jgi:hypothetical protein
LDRPDSSLILTKSFSSIITSCSISFLRVLARTSAIFYSKPALTKFLDIFKVSITLIKSPKILLYQKSYINNNIQKIEKKEYYPILNVENI